MIVAILLPGLTRLAIFIDFKINQDFIADAYCINKDEPLSLCSGKCYLTEQLKKANEKEEKQIPVSQKERLEITYFTPQTAFYAGLLESQVKKFTIPPYRSPFHPTAISIGIFRPPQSALI